MIKSFEDFVSTHKDKHVEIVDPTSPNQCFDLAVKWCENLGVPINVFEGNYLATDIWNKPTDKAKLYFDFIENKVDNKPEKGDIVIFGKGINHVVVATGEGDLKSFKSFSQNDPLFSPCIIKEYDYKYVLGWLRHCPKILVKISDNENNVKKATLFDAIAKYLEVKPEWDTIKDAIDKLKTQILKQNLELDQLKKATQNTSIPEQKPADGITAGSETTLLQFLLSIKEKLIEILHKTIVIQKGEMQ